MNRAGLAIALLIILATMLVGAYAMEAYAPIGSARIVVVSGRGQDGTSVDAVDVVGIQPSVLHALRSRAPSDTGWTSSIRIVVDNGVASSALPQVIGRYSVLGDRVRFRPRFPFTAGVDYRVDVDTERLHSPAGARSTGGRQALLRHRFSLPGAQRDRTTRIIAVHPIADQLPSNMLRWYIEFSAPMEPGAANEHVQLVDEGGRPVTDAFLRVDEELWDAGRQRLTILFDPVG